jgi:hypothetical protein
MADAEKTFLFAPILTKYLPPGGTYDLLLPPIPRQFYPLIGAVAAFWGNFELRMDELLASFVQADGSDHDAGWQRRNFKKRRGLLKDKLKIHFPGAVSTEISSILDGASQLHWQRNLVVHGHFRITNIPGLPVHAEGVIKGKLVKLPITAEFLERMYHELAILGSRLMGCVDPSRSPHALSSQDRSRLRAFLQKHPPNLPTAQMLATQTVSSGE